MNDDIREEFRYLRVALKELIVQGAEHNALLREHEARSLALQSMIEKEKSQREILSLRLEPIETNFKFLTSCLKWFGALLAALIIQFIVRKFF